MSRKEKQPVPPPMEECEEKVNTLVRDLTEVQVRPKSEVRRRIMELLSETRKEKTPFGWDMKRFEEVIENVRKETLLEVLPKSERCRKCGKVFDNHDEGQDGEISCRKCGEDAPTIKDIGWNNCIKEMISRFHGIIKDKDCDFYEMIEK